MKWTVTTLPATTPVSYSQVSSHLRLDNDAERGDVLDHIAAATEYAEQAMECSLITRTITAVIYASDPHATHYGQPYFGQPYFGTTYDATWRRAYELPRGPLVAVTSVTDANGDSPTYHVERHGNAEMLVTTSKWVAPLTVVYTAGYGSDPTSVPADIRQAIKMHAATLYRERESVSDKAKVGVPHSLDDFYRLKSRGTVIG